MNITLDMGETLGANELQAMFHISNSCVLLIFFLLQAARSVVIRSLITVSAKLCHYIMSYHINVSIYQVTSYYDFKFKVH